VGMSRRERASVLFWGAIYPCTRTVWAAGYHSWGCWTWYSAVLLVTIKVSKMQFCKIARPDWNCLGRPSRSLTADRWDRQQTDWRISTNVGSKAAEILLLGATAFGHDFVGIRLGLP